LSKWLVGAVVVVVAAGCTPPAAKPRAGRANVPPPTMPATAPTTMTATTQGTGGAAGNPTGPSMPVADVGGHGGRVVAQVNGRPITVGQLDKPLIEAYGLNVLLNLVQLELARQQVENAHATVTPADVQRERELTLEGMFPNAPKEDYDRLLDQILGQEKITRPEFEIVVETNAHLRKLVAPMMQGKVTEDNLREGFAAFYGETARVRDIRLSNLQEVAAVKLRLANGEAFDQLAREVSRDSRTGPSGGELPPFSRQAQGVPQAFKDAAFSMKPGEVSDPVEADGAYHLIKLEERIAPRAVKFDDVKDAVRQELESRMIQQGMKEFRAQLAQVAMQTLEIREPSLQQQWAARLGKQEAATRDQEKIRQQLEADRARMRKAQGIPDEPAATQPATQPVVPPPSVLRQPAGAPGAKAGDEPPATKPGQ
jgi:parvulin-like peptidyl-prolyl isomerase